MASMGKKFNRQPQGDEVVEDVLTKLVLGDKSPVKYGAPSTVHKYLKDRVPGVKISLAQVKEFVERNVRARALRSQPPSTKFPRLPYRAWGLGDQVQADLMFIESWQQKNILTIIDVFSRRAEAEICYNKAAHNVAAATKRALKRMKIRPNNIQTDQGKEFDNSHFKALVKELNSNWFFVDSSWKAAMVERFNRTLRMKFEVIKAMEPHRRQHDILREAVEQYNNTPHTALKGLTPNDVTYKNNGILLRLQLDDEKLQSEKNKAKQTKFKFEVGQYVRATVERATKGGIRKKVAAGTYTDEVFEIVKRFRKPYQEHINLYRVKDLVGEPITGLFYEDQLKMAHGFDVNRKEIKKVVSKRKRDSLVTLQDYPASHREVVPNAKRFKRGVKN